jgi:hypothetical protein
MEDQVASPLQDGRQRRREVGGGEAGGEPGEQQRDLLCLPGEWALVEF